MNKEATVQNRFKAWYAKDRHFGLLLIILVAVFVAMTIANPAKFFSVPTFQSMLNQFPEYGIMAFGIMLTMIIGGIDLSVVGMANLTAITAASTLLALVKDGYSDAQTFGCIVVAVALGVVVGGACGFLNGVLIGRLRVPAMLVTLGTQQMFTGIGLIITKGSSISRLPGMYSEMGTTLVGGVVPVVLFVFVGVVIVLSILMGKTTYGQQAYMVGSNKTAASFSGIKVESVISRTHMYSGVLAAIAGLIMLANYNSAKPDYGSAYTLQCILIVVLGGVNPDGGFGKVGGVTVAILILQIMSSGLNLFPAISNFYRQMIWGGILLFVLTMNYFSDTKSERLIAKEQKRRQKMKRTEA